MNRTALRYPEHMRYARRRFLWLAAAGSAGLLRTPSIGASEIKFHDAESQSRVFMKWYTDIPLTPSQESVKKAALDPIPAPCCSDNSAYTCCCPCNISRTIWGLSQYMIAKQDATAEFICTRLFQFFAADEVTEEGRRCIAAMKEAYFESGYEIRAVLRNLFNSEYFRSNEARFGRVKGPVELVVGAIRMAGSHQTPHLGIERVSNNMLYMGQGLLQPPTVEGWHEGAEWIDSGALVERVNFAAKELSDVNSPGVRTIIDRLAATGDGVLSPAEFADGCVDLLGPISVREDTREVLVGYASRHGDLDLRERQPGDESEQRVGNMLRLIAATREFQLA